MITDLTYNIQMMLEWDAATNWNSGDEMKEEEEEEKHKDKTERRQVKQKRRENSARHSNIYCVRVYIVGCTLVLNWRTKRKEFIVS